MEMPGPIVWISLALLQFALAGILRYAAGKAQAGAALACVAGALLTGTILRYGSQAGVNAPSLQIYMALFSWLPAGLYGLRCSLAGRAAAEGEDAGAGNSALAWAGLAFAAALVAGQILAPPAARFYLPWALLLVWFGVLSGLAPGALAARVAVAALFFQPLLLLEIARSGGRAGGFASAPAQDVSSGALFLAGGLALWLELRAVRPPLPTLLIAMPAALCGLMSSLAAGRFWPALAGLVGAALAALVGEFFGRSRREARIDSRH